ncbi:collagenase-like [Maniola hyperantus]|uniref:collagenase-like n=1 Tax=Aphantopus hyperantus TaxID=2795564 RepID=UPI0015691C45|nr:collagenase-like [Maniola hyperantus]
MKIFLVFVGLALAASAEDAPIMQDYHEEFGIAAAARIKAAEDAMDFDGARVAGGSAAGLGSNPHVGGLVITLTTNQQSVCGSSLLTNSKLVTAAHCWRHGNSHARQFTVVLGSIRLFTGGNRQNTNRVAMHASYNERTLANDIAIITINHVGYTNHINRILIPTGSNQYAGTWATVAGFGRTGDGTQHGITNNQALSQLSLQVITNAVCSQTFGNSIVASTLCVATPGGRSPCPGDSGGPLAIGSGNNRQLIGIVSFGHSSGCTRGFPAAFARVTSFAAWIRQRI